MAVKKSQIQISQHSDKTGQVSEKGGNKSEQNSCFILGDFKCIKIMKLTKNITN